MKSLHRFLNPVRKENTKFVLSSAFVEDDGTPIEWEMRALGAYETQAINRENMDKETSDIVAMQVAESLVYPNLKDAELVKAFADANGGKILAPHEILLKMLTAAEYNKLVGVFNTQNEVTMNFTALVEEAKN